MSGYETTKDSDPSHKYPGVVRAPVWTIYVEQLGFVLFLGLIVWLPLPWGSEPGWATNIAVTWTFLILLLISARAAFVPSDYWIMKAAKVPLILLCLWLSYACMQAIPINQDWLMQLGLRQATTNSDSIGITDVATISLAPGDTIQKFLIYTAYVVFFLLASVFVRNVRRAVVLASTITGVAVLESLFGFYALFSGFEFTPRYLQDGHFDRVSGTFINRNQFAAHIVMALSLTLGLIFLCSKNSSRREWSAKSLIGRLPYRINGSQMLLVTCSLIMIAALVYSGSRGASLSFIGAIILLLGLDAIFKRNSRNAINAFILILIAVPLVVLFSGTGGLYERFDLLGMSFGERVGEWRLVANMINDHYIYGIGAGTFEWVFPHYRDGSLRALLYNHAHSDYLETLSELGVIGFSLLTAALASITVLIYTGYRHHNTKQTGEVLFGCLIAIFSVLFHSAVDFNFQITANGAYFFIIAGMGISLAKFANQATHER